MDTREIQDQLADLYEYNRLPKDKSEYYQKLYLDNIPEEIIEIINSGLQDSTMLKTKHLWTISFGFTRIVIGDYGAFIEISPEQMLTMSLIIPDNQKFRIKDVDFIKKVKYIWYTIGDGSNVKIYFQRKKVPYADYRVGMYYVSPYDVVV